MIEKGFILILFMKPYVGGIPLMMTRRMAKNVRPKMGERRGGNGGFLLGGRVKGNGL